MELPDAIVFLRPSRFYYTFYKEVALIKHFEIWKLALEIKKKHFHARRSPPWQAIRPRRLAGEPKARPDLF